MLVLGWLTTGDLLSLHKKRAQSRARHGQKRPKGALGDRLLQLTVFMQLIHDMNGAIQTFAALLIYNDAAIVSSHSSIFEALGNFQGFLFWV
ncbi:hypothetical protein ACFPES_20310 [Paenibacillus sp. GCM10023248]|nr:hypothetical protein [Paenibacillus sp. MAHUQ-63]